MSTKELINLDEVQLQDVLDNLRFYANKGVNLCNNILGASHDKTLKDNTLEIRNDLDNVLKALL